MGVKWLVQVGKNMTPCNLKTQVRFLPRPLILKQIDMPNMSYCRFENTVMDMRDCINAIEDGECDELSSYEVRALKQFKRMGDEINRLDIDIDLILEKYDS